MKSSRNLGLTMMTTEELKKLLGHCHRDEVAYPMTVKSLACIGFQYKQEIILNALRRLDNEAVKALLICVIAERLSSPPSSAISSWPDKA